MRFARCLREAAVEVAGSRTGGTRDSSAHHTPSVVGRPRARRGAFASVRSGSAASNCLGATHLRGATDASGRSPARRRYRPGLGTSAAISRPRDAAPSLSVAPGMRAVSQMSAATSRTRLEAPMPSSGAMPPPNATRVEAAQALPSATCTRRESPARVTMTRLLHVPRGTDDGVLRGDGGFT